MTSPNLEMNLQNGVEHKGRMRTSKLEESEPLGKRIRKPNTLFADYEQDNNVHDAKLQVSPSNRKELLCTAAEAREKSKKLPKGYAYVPTLQAPSDSNIPTSPTRLRRRGNQSKTSPRVGKKQKNRK